ncbi:hypothetical protein GCM10014715_58280 [Streptomyces spiralis]|uniref:Uncharacterized protein n=1 Tax=Streptomyces spiralis TaxID=66376 RepID=A0A919A9S6_9ACTN|nr:hypothetical protein [Streptomyces spiralis]GHE94331.1 hypothetical protein GCM10014715_58280 [Streptomyces spiralis]
MAELQPGAFTTVAEHHVDDESLRSGAARYEVVAEGIEKPDKRCRGRRERLADETADGRGIEGAFELQRAGEVEVAAQCVLLGVAEEAQARGLEQAGLAVLGVDADAQAGRLCAPLAVAVVERCSCRLEAEVGRGKIADVSLDQRPDALLRVEVRSIASWTRCPRTHPSILG